MSSVNKAILVGNVGKDPEIRMTASGSKIANFSIATSEKRKDKQTGQYTENTEWHRLTAFGNTAEVIEKYVTKGSKLYIEGRIQTRKWTDKDNQERYTTEIMVDQLTMLDSKGDKSDAPVATGLLDDEMPF